MDLSKIIKVTGLAGVAMTLAAPAAAQADGQMRLSYCKGEVAASSQIGAQGENTVEAASYIPADMVSYYKNLRIVGINAGLASKLNVVSLTVWVRSELDGENLQEQTIDTGNGQTIVKGWNNLSFNNVEAITTDKGFYVGYTIRQKGSCYAISAVGSDHDGGLYVNTDSSWEDKSGAGLGTLSIETIIEADNLPTFDLAAAGIDLPQRVQKGTTVPVNLLVSNLASRTISEFDLVCNVTGLEETVYHIKQEILPCSEDTVTFDFAPAFEERQKGLEMTVTIDNLKEGDDIDISNNSVAATFDFVKHDFTRTTLVEEFTTENCSNCPMAIPIITGVLEDEEFDGKVLALSHHSGYMTDWLTTDADVEFLRLYGSGSYAPAVMYDRYTDKDTPVCGVGSSEEIKEILRQRLDEPANAMLSVSAKGDEENNKVSVKVSGAIDWSFDLSDPRITVCVVENNIEAENQAGASSDFIHQHVLRAYNEVWGAPLEWDENDEFEYECELEIDDSWKCEDMEIIAFVNNYDAVDISNCAVENATRCDIEWVKGVGETMAGDRQIVSTEYYDIAGMKVYSPSAGGIYIKVEHFDDGSTVTSKLIW